MPRFDNEQELIENLRQYAKDGLLSAGYTASAGLEKIRLEIINGTVVFYPVQTLQDGTLKSNISFLLYQFKNSTTHHQPLDDYHCLTHFDVKIDDNNLYSPTVLVEKITQKNHTNDIYYLQKPQIIFEILTNQNKHLLNAKFEHYQTIPTLQEYVLVDGHEPQVWIYRKQNHWQAEHYAHHQSFILQSIDFMVNVVDIYRDVNFDQKQPNQET